MSVIDAQMESSTPISCPATAGRINPQLLYEPNREKTCFCHMRKQRCRSACASAQSDQRLCYSLLRQYNTSSFFIRNFKPVVSFCGCAGRFVSDLVTNPEDRFSRGEAHMVITKYMYLLTGIIYINNKIYLKLVTVD